MHRGWIGTGSLVIGSFMLLGAMTARAGYPSAGQLGEAKAVAEKLVGQADKLQSEIQKKWSSDRQLIDRAGRFAQSCRHLVAIMNEALRKGEYGRHTQSAYGSVKEEWSRLNAVPSAGGFSKWKERSQINKLLDELTSYYQ